MIIYDESIENLEKEISKRKLKIEEIKKTLEFKSLSELFELRIKFQDFISEYGVDSEQVRKFAKKNLGKEQALLKAAEKESDLKYIDKIIKKQIKIENEIYEISRHIWRMNLKSGENLQMGMKRNGSGKLS